MPLESSKPPSQDLAIAYAVKKRAQRKAKGGLIRSSYAEGGEVENEKLHPDHPERSPIVHAIMRKRMADGGMVEEDSDDFLSAGEQDHVPDLTYPDLDQMEDTEGMGPLEEDPMEKRKGILSQIMMKRFR